jgi:hypothetical protein
MDKNQAIQTIEQAIDVAVQKGVYSLNDMVFIIDALNALKSE